jgi:hypothetical protein
MLSVMRDPDADHKRRDAMAMAAAPYLHPKVTAIDAKLCPVVSEPSPERPTSVQVTFVVPGKAQTRDDEE